MKQHSHGRSANRLRMLVQALRWGRDRLRRTRTPAVFAGLFIKPMRPSLVPAGYYDPSTQLYHDAKTMQPMFLSSSWGPTGGEKPRSLTDEELADLLRSGRFVDVGQFRMAGRGTWSNQTTLSTTRCCPIVTDSETDRGEDDTPSTPFPE